MPTRLPATNLTKHTIDVRGHQPIKQCHRHLSPKVEEASGEGAQEGQRERGAVPKVTAPRKARKRSRKKKVSGEFPASEDVQPEVPEPRDRKPAFRDFGFGICREDLTEGLPVSTGPVARQVWPVAALRERPSEASDPAPSPLAGIEAQVAALLGTRPPSVPAMVNKPVPAPTKTGEPHARLDADHPLIRAIAEAILKRL